AGDHLAEATGPWQAVDKGRVQHDVHGVDVVIRGLHGQAVVDPVGRVDPEIGSHLGRRAERHQQTAGHVLLGQPQLRRHDAIDVQAQVRPVRYLVEVNVRDAGEVGDLAAQFLGDGEAA